MLERKSEVYKKIREWSDADCCSVKVREDVVDEVMA